MEPEARRVQQGWERFFAEVRGLRDEVQAHLARMEEELESARQLQMSMVPTMFPQSTAQL